MRLPKTAGRKPKIFKWPLDLSGRGIAQKLLDLERIVPSQRQATYGPLRLLPDSAKQVAILSEMAAGHYCRAKGLSRMESSSISKMSVVFGPIAPTLRSP